MKSAYTRSELLENLQRTYADPAQLKNIVGDVEMPGTLVTWLANLALLNGVPFNYLVPDEAMLPSESIRFFYLDVNWIAALVDGAMSIGRNLSTEVTSELNLQKAITPQALSQVKKTLPAKRAKAFGLSAPEIDSDSDIISGFVLRSSLVLDYPSMSVNVYPLGGTPNDPDTEALTILRLEQLGPTSDTMICLVAGDAYRVDIHEAPQALHYGIDAFDEGTDPVTAVKNLYTFGNTTVTVDGVTTNSVTMSDTASATDIHTCFRSSNRVLQMSTLADTILAKNISVGPPAGTTSPTKIDSAEMGFEMTQGVGLVSFYKSISE